jgi:hypothetical protein
VKIKHLVSLSTASLLTAMMQLGAVAQQGKGAPHHDSQAAKASVSDDDNANTLNYTTSWIGNSLPGDGTGSVDALKHIPIDIDGIYATPDGKVYTNTTWDEGGRPVSIFKNGQLISPLNDLDGSPNWSNGGGSAVAADPTHIFVSETPNGTGVGILDAATMNGTTLQLTGSSTLYTSHGVEGLTIHNGSLYLTQQDFNKVEIYDLTSLALTQTLTIDNPVLIAVDHEGGLWISHRDQTPFPNVNGIVYNYQGQFGLPTIGHYNSSGSLINSIDLPAGGQVNALWIDKLGYLFVGDNGPDQNIKVYGNLLHTPALVTTLGVKGGVHEGDFEERGRVGDWRFRGITGIATDDQENIYVSENGFTGFGVTNGHGVQLQSYNLFGAKNWGVHGLEFVATLDVDPHSENDIYDAYHHFKVDYSRPTGKEARYVADTYDRFKYPDDVRVTGISSTAQIQYIQGHKFLLVGNQPGVYLAIYRFDDSPSGPGKEVAIPCAAFDYGAFQQQYLDFVNEPVNGEFIWRDINGDGRIDSNEFVQPPNDLHRDGANFWMDSNGDVWQVNYQAEYPPYEQSIHLRRYLFEGFDSFGAPIYDYNHMMIYNVPTDFPTITQVQQVIFKPEESEGGTLYVAANSPTNGNFSQILRYDHWDKGNRTAKWTIQVPYDSDPNNTWTPNSFIASGKFLFVDFNYPHYTVIYDTDNGAYVGKFTPGSDVGGLPNVGNDDEGLSMHSFRRSNGEYLLLHEEDYQAKQLMYRWTPPSTLKPPPIPEVPVIQTATGGDGTATITWSTTPDALVYNVSRSTSKNGPFTLVQAGVVGDTVTDSPLVDGDTYYYVVSALTIEGLSANSAPFSVVPVPFGTTYEASTAVLGGGAQTYSCPLCANGEQVGYLIPGATITINGITAPSTGNYAVRISYENGDSTPTDTAYIGLVVNGTTTLTSPNLSFTGSYSTPGYVTIDVPLNKGSNTIVLGNPASDPNGAPNVDRIVVSFQPI